MIGYEYRKENLKARLMALGDTYQELHPNAERRNQTWLAKEIKKSRQVTNQILGGKRVSKRDYLIKNKIITRLNRLEEEIKRHGDE